jgi:hypothetical protein
MSASIKLETLGERASKTTALLRIDPEDVERFLSPVPAMHAGEILACSSSRTVRTYQSMDNKLARSPATVC